MLESLFSKVAGLKGCNFIKQRLQHRCFPVNIVIFWEKLFYRTPLMAASELGKKYVIVVAKSTQATLKTSLKAHQQISKKKTVFRKLLFVWYNMPIFNFTGYTLTELFRKPDNWRQIYKQMSSTSNVCETRWEEKIVRTP